MHTQLDIWSDIGGISPGYTFFHWCVKRKREKKEKKKKDILNTTWTKRVRFNYIFVCEYMCLGITAKHLEKKEAEIQHVLSMNPGENY